MSHYTFYTYIICMYIFTLPIILCMYIKRCINKGNLFGPGLKLWITRCKLFGCQALHSCASNKSSWNVFTFCPLSHLKYLKSIQNAITVHFKCMNLITLFLKGRKSCLRILIINLRKVIRDYKSKILGWTWQIIERNVKFARSRYQ